MLALDNVLRLAQPGRTRVLYVSSSEVYGRPGCFAEDADKVVYAPYTTRLEYATAKILCEISAVNYAKRTGVSVNVVRPFNIVGPRQASRGGFVVPRFFEAALSGAPITVFGDGRQIRCFTDVCDVVDSLLAVMSSSRSGLIVNSGNPDNAISIRELAHLIKRVCDSDSRIVHVDPRTIFGALYTEAFDKIPDIELIKRETGWTPRRSLPTLLEALRVHFQATLCPRRGIGAAG